MHSGDIAEAHRTDAEHLEGGGHRVRGKLPTAGPRTGTGAVLDGAQFFGRDPPSIVGTDRFKHVLNGKVAALIFAVHDRAAIEHQTRDIDPREGHHCAGDRFIATGQGNHGIEEIAAGDELDGVGNHLAADQGRLHPLGAHGDSVRDGDRVEL